MSNKDKINQSLDIILEELKKIHPDTDLGKELNSLYQKDEDIKNKWDEFVGYVVGGG